MFPLALPWETFEGLGETKLTASLGASHFKVLIITRHHDINELSIGFVRYLWSAVVSWC